VAASANAIAAGDFKTSCGTICAAGIAASSGRLPTIDVINTQPDRQ